MIIYWSCQIYPDLGPKLCFRLDTPTGIHTAVCTTQLWFGSPNIFTTGLQSLESWPKAVKVDFKCSASTYRPGPSGTHTQSPAVNSNDMPHYLNGMVLSISSCFIINELGYFSGHKRSRFGGQSEASTEYRSTPPHNNRVPVLYRIIMMTTTQDYVLESWRDAPPALGKYRVHNKIISSPSSECVHIWHLLGHATKMSSTIKMVLKLSGNFRIASSLVCLYLFDSLVYLGCAAERVCLSVCLLSQQCWLTRLGRMASKC